jgi:hypothetical protein
LDALSYLLTSLPAFGSTLAVMTQTMVIFSQKKDALGYPERGANSKENHGIQFGALLSTGLSP